jgi:hypothetical protein
VLLAGAQLANISQDSSGFEMSFRDDLLGAGGGTAGVTSLNGLTGALTLKAGANVAISPSGSTITISASGGGGGSGLAFVTHNATLQGDGSASSPLGVAVPLVVTSAGPVLEATATGLGKDAISGTAGAGVGLHGYTETGFAVYGQSTSGMAVQADTTDGFGVHAVAQNGYAITAGNDSPAHPAVLASNTGGGAGVSGTGNPGIGGLGGSGADGVDGASSSSGRSGVYGVNSVAGGYGVFGRSTHSGGVAVAGSGDNGGRAAHFYAGDVYIDNNLHVNGSVSKGGGSFEIDHPLDPANKILFHSFVESPDMMNIYSGIARLDASGTANIDLPKWFEALNRDFRYQLTALDTPQPGLFVSRRIEGNRFTVAGGVPGAEISWQVTGVRHDRWAEAHRIPVETEKPARQKGFYLHPELYGASPEKQINGADETARSSSDGEKP